MRSQTEPTDRTPVKSLRDILRDTPDETYRQTASPAITTLPPHLPSPSGRHERLAGHPGRHPEGQAGRQHLQWQCQQEAQEGIEAHHHHRRRPRPRGRRRGEQQRRVSGFVINESLFSYLFLICGFWALVVVVDPLFYFYYMCSSSRGGLGLLRARTVSGDWPPYTLHSTLYTLWLLLRPPAISHPSSRRLTSSPLPPRSIITCLSSHMSRLPLHSTPPLHHDLSVAGSAES